MLYIKWVLIYLTIPVFYLLIIGIGLLIAPQYKPAMFSIPVVLTAVLIVGLIISTVKQEKQSIK